MKQKIIFVFIILMVLISFSNIVMARDTTVERKSIGDVMTEADNFLGAGTEDKLKDDNIKTVSANLYNGLVVAAIITSVIIGVALGIKLITSGAIGKAEVKEVFVPYLIGNAIAFGAFAIWKIVVDVLNSTAT